MPKSLDINEFIFSSFGNNVIIDVRSPKEFLQGHIPNAINIPLFDNDERAEVGTIYKQKGKQEAISRGLEIVGPKMATIANTALSLAKDNTIYVHCWRGGMRSGSVAWLLELYGLKVFTLKGGYKSFRKTVLHSFTKQYPFVVLGGKTGSGKTLILNKLLQLNQQVIDLEGLAHHKGSAFGALGETPPPSQEHFENKLACQLICADLLKPIWVEDEGRMIGKKVIPEGIWNQIRTAKILHINLPFEERVKYLVAEYGKFSKQELEASILKITKRLGSQQTKESIEALNNGDLATTCRLCLHYYDKTYHHGLLQREKSTVLELDFDTLNVDDIAETLKQNILT